ncbi:MAG TPA: hypothetical protein VG986_13530 [Pseudolabrys sp.]|nr:hypothetical protein [Pseudolabrys sp.]
MVGRLARGAYLLILVGMIVAYALQAAKSDPSPQNDTPPLPTDRMYC